MAFTKVLGPGIHTLANVTSHNINSSGIVTATKFVGPFDTLSGDYITGIAATFSGNVSIGGTLTYMDVTNVDAVGIITAQEGIHLGVGATVGRVDVTTGISTFNSIGIANSIFHIGDTDTFMKYNSNEIVFETGAASKVFINDAGDLTVGASEGSLGKLYIKQAADTDTEGLALLNSGGSNSFRLFLGDSSGGVAHFGHGGQKQFNITQAGLVGIGVTNPGIYSNLAYNLVLRTTGNTGMTLRSGSGSKGGILFASADNNTSNEGIFQYDHDSKAFEFNNYGGGAEKFLFKIQGTEKVRIDSAGRLGINTDTFLSGEMLSIRGGANDSSEFNFHSYADFLGATDAWKGYTALFRGANASNSNNQWLGIGATTAHGWIDFANNSASRITITSTGVGINETTPEERLDLGEANQQNLKVGQRGYLGQGYSTGATILGHSVKAKTTGTTSGGMIVTETNSGGGAPSAIRQESGTIQFHTAASGTADADFDSEKVRITSAGNVGINDNNPNARLVVAQSGLADNTYSFAANYRSGVNASGYTASGISISGTADDSNGDKHTSYINFSSRDPALNGSHGSSAWITMTNPDSQSTYGTGQLDFYIRHAAAYSFPNDPQAASGYWMNSLFTIKSSGRVGINSTSPSSALDVKGDMTIYNSNNQGDIFFGEHGDVSDHKALIRMDQLSSTSGELQFHTEGSGTLTERLNINSDGIVNVKGNPSHFRLYNTRDTSDWDAEDPIGKIDFYVGDDVSNNLPYNTGFIHCINSHLDNQNEPGGNLIFGTTPNNESGGAVETMRLSHQPGYNNHANLQTNGPGAIRDVYDMMNINMAGTGFDAITNNSDGGGTTWEVQDSRTIRLYNTSGGHGGNWGKQVAVRQDGWYYMRMCLRLTTTCTYIHSSTPTTKYRYPIGVIFRMNSDDGSSVAGGYHCIVQLWEEFATEGTCNVSQSGTGTLPDGVRVTRTGNARYLTQGLYQPIYHTNGYSGVRELNILSLELVQCGSTTSGNEHNGTW